jgi:hypothetical protein
MKTSRRRARDYFGGKISEGGWVCEGFLSGIFVLALN